MTDITSFGGKAVCLSFTLFAPTRRRHVDPSKITTDADPSMLHITKDILDAPAFSAIDAWDRKTRAYLNRRALPLRFFQGGRGIKVVPVGLIPEVRRVLTGFLDARNDLIEVALGVYPELVRTAPQRLKSLFNARDYPPVDVLRGSYSFELQAIPMAVPEELQAVDPEFYETQSGALQQKVQESLELIQVTLRQELLALLKRATKRLSPVKGSRPSEQEESLIYNLQDFLNVFDMRNLSDDTELEALVQRCQLMMKRVDDPQDLRTDDELRQEVQQVFAEVGDLIEKLPGITAVRRIQLPDDEE